MGILFALAWKDIRLLIRDKAGLFFTFFFPILYSVFFGLIMGNMGQADSNAISIILVDLDQTDHSKKFGDGLKASDAFLVYTGTTVEAAADSVRRGNQVAYVAIPKGFGERQSRVFWGDPPSLEVGIDPSRKAEAGMLQGLLTREVFKGIQEAFSKPEQTQAMIREAVASLDAPGSDMNPAMASALKLFLPMLDQFMSTVASRSSGDGEADAQSFGFREPEIQVHEVTRQVLGPNIESAYQITCPQGMIWGIMSCAAGFALSMVIERNNGTLVRLRTAPISRGAIVGGKALGCFIIAMALSVLILAIFIVGFGVRIHSYPLLVMAVVSVAGCFVGLMMLFSILGKTEQGASGAAWAILLVMAMLGGGMIPLAFMPKQMAPLSIISPVRWSILAVEGAIWRGFSTVEMLTPCAVLLGIGVVAFALGERVMRRMV